MSALMRGAIVMTALGCGVAGGVFFAFSTFVMQGLSRLPQSQGLAAMQSINITAVRPGLMGLLFGTAVMCVCVMTAALFRWNDRYSGLVIAAACLYLIGTIGLTIGYHVPRNDALAALDPAGTGSEGSWVRYAIEWTRWNHVRTMSSTAAAAAFMVAVVRG